MKLKITQPCCGQFTWHHPHGTAIHNNSPELKISPCLYLANAYCARGVENEEGKGDNLVSSL